MILFILLNIFQFGMAQSNSYFTIVVVIIIPSTLSNITLWYIIATKQILRTVPNIYLGSSLVAQLPSLFLVGLHVLVHITIQEVTTVSAFFACMTAVERFLLAAMVLSFVGLSFERCKYFVKSSTYIPDYRETKKALVSLWAISIIYGMTGLAIGYLAQFLSNPSHQVCLLRLVWTLLNSNKINQNLIYSCWRYWYKHWAFQYYQVLPMFFWTDETSN